MNKKLVIILTTILLDTIGYGLVIPVLPFIIQGYGYSQFWVGLTLTIFFLGIFFGGYIFGKLSDRLGRNNTLLITITLLIISYLGFSLSTSLFFFIFFRFLAGLGSSGWAVAQAYIVDFSKTNKERTSNMGYVGAMFGIGFIVGPFLGGIISGNLGINYIGYIAAIFSILNLLSVYFLLPKLEKDNKKEVVMNKEEEKQPSKSLLKDKTILALFLVSILAAIGSSTFQSTLPLLAHSKYNFTPEMVGYLFGFIGIIMIIYQIFILKKLQKKFDLIKMSILGLTCFTLSLFLFGFNNYLPALFIIIFIYAIGYSTVQPSTYSMLGALGKKQVGKVIGTNVSLTSLGNAGGSLIAGILYVMNDSLPYITSGILGLIAIGVIYFYVSRRKNEFL